MKEITKILEKMELKKDVPKRLTLSFFPLSSMGEEQRMAWKTAIQKVLSEQISLTLSENCECEIELYFYMKEPMVLKAVSGQRLLEEIFWLVRDVNAFGIDITTTTMTSSWLIGRY